MRTVIIFLCLFFSITPCLASRNPQEIINQFDAQYSKIKDATMDVTLDTSLQILGCSGLTRFKGKGYFKAPAKIQITLNKTIYFVHGNNIRKIDPDGKRYYVRFINAQYFTPCFNQNLIPYNFNLTTLKDGPDDIVIDGLPKPGVLKNVTKVTFHFDPKSYLLRQLDLTLINKKKPEYIYIDYKLIDGIWVPVSCHGRSAIELRAGLLVGLDLKLKGGNFQLNKGLADKIFEPGF
jgi:hypothetical protein